MSEKAGKRKRKGVRGGEREKGEEGGKKKKGSVRGRRGYEEDRMMSFRSEDNSFNGHIVVQGWNICEAELTVQFKHNHRNTYDEGLHWRLNTPLSPTPPSRYNQINNHQSRGNL